MNQSYAGFVLASILSLMSGCAAAPDAEICKSMRSFARAPLDASGLRRAWFLPFGSYEDGSIDFYAPMASEPTDDASKSFYEDGVGQLTHYLRAPEFAAALAACLGRRYGYTPVCVSQTEETFRASLTDGKSGRSIELFAAEKSTSVLVAEKGWNGNLEEFLVYKASKQTPSKSNHPTCEDARADE